MQQIHTHGSMSAEHEELVTVTQALARSRRLAELLRYIGEEYFAGRGDELTEYNIATNVFGRSKTVFNSGEDAIARVEAHRLRKRLRDYYEGDGKDHPIRISIPVGSYVPQFSLRSEERTIPEESQVERIELVIDAGVINPAKENLQPVAVPDRTPSPPIPNFQAIRGWKRWAIGAVILGAFGSFLMTGLLKKRGEASSTGSTVASGLLLEETAVAPAAARTSPVRIIAGYDGPPQVDSAGETWKSDAWFHGGGSWRREEGLPISRTSDPWLFKQWRTGDFRYDIPLAPGVYELHLYFLTSDSSYEKTSTFYVSINGTLALQDFDINSDAMGANIADERIIRDVSPSKDGYVHLSFSNEIGTPALNALELIPGTPKRQLPIRIVTQTTPFRDHKGQVWHPDTYFMNGRLHTELRPVSGDPELDLFVSERFGHFDYALPVDPRGRYTVVLHFAEFYFGSPPSGQGGTGSRVFRVVCNGNTLLDNFDIYEQAGALHAVVKAFHHLKPTAQGKLNLTFEPIVNNATVSGIEVLDESN